MSLVVVRMVGPITASANGLIVQITPLTSCGAVLLPSLALHIITMHYTSPEREREKSNDDDFRGLQRIRQEQETRQDKKRREGEEKTAKEDQDIIMRPRGGKRTQR